MWTVWPTLFQKLASRLHLCINQCNVSYQSNNLHYCIWPSLIIFNIWNDTVNTLRQATQAKILMWPPRVSRLRPQRGSQGTVEDADSSSHGSFWGARSTADNDGKRPALPAERDPASPMRDLRVLGTGPWSATPPHPRRGPADWEDHCVPLHFHVTDSLIHDSLMVTSEPKCGKAQKAVLFLVGLESFSQQPISTSDYSQFSYVYWAK